MPDLNVVYDDKLQIGAIVDLDTNMGWGPICPGPDGGNLLQAFIDGMPFDLTILSSEQARDIFLSVFREDAERSIASQTANDPDTLVAPHDPVATASAFGDSTIVEEASSAPPPAPADSDAGATGSEMTAAQTDPTVTVPYSQPIVADPVVPVSAPTVSNCLLCNSDGTGSKNPGCVMCGGTGKVQAAQ
jgi:hypothetical protein